MHNSRIQGVDTLISSVIVCFPWSIICAVFAAPLRISCAASRRAPGPSTFNVDGPCVVKTCMTMSSRAVVGALTGNRPASASGAFQITLDKCYTCFLFLSNNGIHQGTICGVHLMFELISLHCNSFVLLEEHGVGVPKTIDAIRKLFLFIPHTV